MADDTAKQLAEDGDLTPAKPARLLDIFVCINQGYLMAHKRQALLLGATLKVSLLTVVSYAFYPVILGIIASVAFWRITRLETEPRF